MKMKKMEALSKFFTYILRHDPEKFGLSLGKNHYCKLEDFYNSVIEHWNKPLSKEEISYVLLNSMWEDKHRFDVWRGYVRATYKSRGD